MKSRKDPDTAQNVLVTGGAGALGSSLTIMLLAHGYRVNVVDRLQQNHAWRLRDVAGNERLTYVWKAVEDMTEKDIDGIGTILYCNAQADRPLGISSPVQVQKASAIGALLCMIAERGEITTSELLRKVRSEGIFDEGDLVTILLSLAKWHIIEFQRKHTRHLTLSSSRRSFN